MKDMINFTVGPVMSSDSVREIGGWQVPYFRTSEFSDIMFENERLMKCFSGAAPDARTVFITGSGTASMEASVMNVFTERDKVLIVNGGSFGARFVQICQIHKIPHTEIKLAVGQPLSASDLEPYEQAGYTGFLVNMHETSTGVLYDMPMIGAFCRRNHLFLVVDAISAFMADPFNMQQLGVGVMITGSQKALACPPGISVIVLSPEAVERVNRSETRCMYFDLKDALKNGERGQTPFTPAVSVLLQIHRRLLDVEANGGVESEIRRMNQLANDFRKKIDGLPFDIVSRSLSNAVTPLHSRNKSAFDIFTILKDNYQIWVCPNGGELRDSVFRVGHLGALTTRDNTTLVNALSEIIEA